tara:strand:- start:7109 stop:7258 length:150 start_codon:yes stop_codon:yes gene_type:complete
VTTLSSHSIGGDLERGPSRRNNGHTGVNLSGGGDQVRASDSSDDEGERF